MSVYLSSRPLWLRWVYMLPAQLWLPKREGTHFSGEDCAGNIYTHRKVSFVQRKTSKQRFQAEAGAVGKGDFALHNSHSLEAVVGNQQIAVEVGEIADWR